MHDIVILSGARTAIGTFGGSLAGTAPGALVPLSRARPWPAPGGSRAGRSAM